jgi:hypothetical protein
VSATVNLIKIAVLQAFNCLWRSWQEADPIFTLMLADGPNMKGVPMASVLPYPSLSPLSSEPIAWATTVAFSSQGEEKQEVP